MVFGWKQQRFGSFSGSSKITHLLLFITSWKLHSLEICLNILKNVVLKLFVPFNLNNYSLFMQVVLKMFLNLCSIILYCFNIAVDTKC